MSKEKNFSLKAVAAFGTMMAIASALVLTVALFSSIMFLDQALLYRNMEVELFLHTAVAVTFAFAFMGGLLIYMAGSFMKK